MSGIGHENRFAIHRQKGSRDYTALQGDGLICYLCPIMDELTEDAAQEIERVHARWIDFEVAGDDHSLMAMCADDIELWPPDSPPVIGRGAVSAQLTLGTTRIQGIEITDRRIRGSNEIAYLTATYTTTFSSGEGSTPQQILGSHLWILRKQTCTWVVTLVSWSIWGRAGACQRHPFPISSPTSWKTDDTQK